MASELIQIYYHESQLPKLFPFAKPYFNNKLTVFFENSVIADKVMSSRAKNVSVCSWKLKEKLRWNVGRSREITEELLDSDYEVLSFTKNSRHHDMLAAAEVWHPGFNKVLGQMMEKIGQRMPLSRIKCPINQNHFSARRDVYQDYVKSWLSPAMEALKTIPEAFSDSNYTKLNPDATTERLQEQIGMPYYPLAPFILERLFSVYCQTKSINVEYL